MNIVDRIVLELPCPRCGGRYEVPLTNVLASQDQMHAACPVDNERECPQIPWSRLVGEGTVRELEDAWERIERTVQERGGDVHLRGEDEAARSS